ncbi:MAG: hypothetical protein RMK84_11455 [Oscillochloridaceae bacterium]|nr:hypothetical protein [Chloroflexaceae bacterium]MDW8390731.1 hypothetical protein [Oscillochloridaceae bacterium]
MTFEELARGVQFMVDQQGHTTAVVLTPELWRQILEALEDAEDRELLRTLRDRIAAGPRAAGALQWNEVSNEWE